MSLSVQIIKLQQFEAILRNFQNLTQKRVTHFLSEFHEMNKL